MARKIQEERVPINVRVNKESHGKLAAMAAAHGRWVGRELDVVVEVAWQQFVAADRADVPVTVDEIVGRR